jgi:hypothetical protein
VIEIALKFAVSFALALAYWNMPIVLHRINPAWKDKDKYFLSTYVNNRNQDERRIDADYKTIQ